MLNKLETKMLTKGHVLLRPIDNTDAPFVFKLRSDTDNMRFVDMKLYEDKNRAERFIRAVSNDMAAGRVCFWVIYLPDTKDLIGTVCLWNITEDGNSAEIGYELLPDHQGHGYMREAVSMVIDYAFSEAGLSRIEAITHKDHNSSLSLLSHLNFQHQGFLEQIHPDSQDGPDMVLYSLKNE